VGDHAGIPGTVVLFLLGDIPILKFGTDGSVMGGLVGLLPVYVDHATNHLGMPRTIGDHITTSDKFIRITALDQQM